MQQYRDAREFHSYVKNERVQFALKSHEVLEWYNMPASHRVIIENLLIAYDQMAERLTPPSSHQGDVVVALDEYIDLLGKEIDSLVDIASVHGWESSNYEAGEILRKKISQLRSHPAPPTNQGDFSHLGPEAELVINSVYEGAELWKQEYDDCRRLLQELVALKKIKDTDGKTDFYLKRQPELWAAAELFLSTYQHNIS